MKEFEAKVLLVRETPGGAEVLLDRTAFYPSSGGQPSDTGFLDGIRVIEAIEKEEEIFHAIEGSLEPGKAVRGTVDWDRRFDLMQQHTGQHVLSQAFLAENVGETLSVHIGFESSNLELSAQEASDEILDSVEKAANAIVEECRPVKTYFVTPEELEALPLRKPAVSHDRIRIVERDFPDLSCRIRGESGEDSGDPCQAGRGERRWKKRKFPGIRSKPGRSPGLSF
ncbi:MAG: alanyl-tRNA editing protein [Candidatus Eisenbacteria bacterium]|nr:alanyl-tRNA editing protein [Candidatus Eisenbacteria bacterium]